MGAKWVFVMFFCNSRANLNITGDSMLRPATSVFGTNSLRRRCCKPTPNCNKSRELGHYCPQHSTAAPNTPPESCSALLPSIAERCGKLRSVAECCEEDSARIKTCCGLAPIRAQRDCVKGVVSCS